MIIRGQFVIDFLENKVEDYKGRTFSSMLDWTDEQLERCHDQVQHFFPLHEESKHAHTYPIVDKDIIEKAKQSEVIRRNLLLAKDRFEKFYGIGQYEDVNKQRKWCKDRNHNLLRITRIIRCLRLFGLDIAASDFYINVITAAKQFDISEITFEYWRKAKVDDVWETLQ